jgi:phenylpropionate dioxygenase-like ring-hydroxylating dioxygenase large terminal subunit
MLSREENDLICRVGPGTPMGKVFRAFWTPVCTSAQLAKPDSDPLRVRLFGEDFVAFRDTNGKVGVLDELCMHRGASLALGRVEDCGIRCLYHGWKFGVDGTIQETPNCGDNRVKERLKAPVYPVYEAGGIVWGYFGPKEKQPPLPRWPFIGVPETHRTVIRVNVNANFLQLTEGGMDSSHVGVLHSNMARPGWMNKAFEQNTDPTNPAALAVEDNAPTLDIEDTEFGFHYAATRKGVGDGTNNVRVVPFIMPSTRIIPARNTLFTVFEVPADDENTSTYLAIYSTEPVDRSKIVALLGLDDARYWTEEDIQFKATWTNRLGQNRARMKDSWTGLRGVEIEDAVIALSQGALFDRSKEHLVAADRAVVRMRQIMIASARKAERGEAPVGASSDMGIITAIDANQAPGAKWQSLVPQHIAAQAAQ